MLPSFFEKLLAATLVVSGALVSASPSLHKRYAVKDYHPSPRGWNNIGRCPGEHMINLSIGLKQSNFRELERQLYEVSNPENARYGQHLSADEVHELVKPSASTFDTVHAWLEEHGVDTEKFQYSPARDWIRVSLPVEKIERLLDTEYSIWEHNDGSMLVRTEAFSLPLNLHDHISTIQPTNSFARLNPHKVSREIVKRDSMVIHLPDEFAQDVPPPSSPEIAAVCNFTAVTPTCLRTLYGTINYTAAANSTSRMGIVNYLENYSNRSDTYVFLNKYRPEAAQAAYQFTQISVDGGIIDNSTQHAADRKGIEGNLDSEYILGVGWPLQLTTYGVAGRDPTYVPDAATPPPNSDEPFLAWVNYVLGQNPSDVPQMISTSYGDDEQTVSKAYAEAVCNQFAQLGARGVSLLFSSGDSGVGETGACISNKDNSTKMFLPAFPAACPYVTAVGGTYMYPEQAAFAMIGDDNIFASGGGFSNYYAQPSYQSAIADQYVASLNGLYQGLYNPKGRAYPDIACVGQRFPIIWNGTTHPVAGTSGSSPICAGVLALVNDALLANGKRPLGFLNPWLYHGGYKAFTDVTNGSSYGCGVDGFPAQAGWDAVTGWGTPYFPDILANLGISGNADGGWGNWGEQR